MAIVVACGAECQVLAQGLGGTTTNRHWSTVGSTPTINTSVQRSGNRCWEFNATAEYFQRTCPTTAVSVLYFRGYFRLSDATPASDIRLLQFAVGVGLAARVVLRTTGILEVNFAGASIQTGPTLSDNTWYGIEAEFDYSANPSVIRWRTWDGSTWTSRTNSTSAQAATTITSVQFGQQTGPGSMSVFFDDVLIGESTTTGSDYSTSVSKGGKVLRYRPVADLAHSFTTNDFEYNDATGIASSATDMWSYVDDDDQSSIADFISQNVSGTGKSFQVDFDSESTETDPRAVAVTMTFHSSGTTANEANVRVSDDGATWTNVLGDFAGAGNDVSDTTAHFRHAVLATKPSGGAWTQAAVNAMRAQLGASDNLASIPYYDGISLEVAWTDAVGGSGAATAIPATMTGTGAQTFTATAATAAVAASMAGTGTHDAGVDLVYVAPDADVTTTGWTTAPLWSKVDEDPASPDGTVITGTA